MRRFRTIHRVSSFHRIVRCPSPLLLLAALILSLLAALPPATVAAAPPTLLLPTPPGQAWRIIQGYACGTHNAWDRYSLDLAAVDGSTIGEPIRAAADGRVWSWTSGSGTIILSHGGDFYTMYTHLSSAVSTREGTFFAAGQVLGAAGERETVGDPHLHFTAFTMRGGWQSVPLRFAEGINLPEIGGCNQHGGKIVTAAPQPEPKVVFTSDAEAGHWYTTDKRVDFTVEWGGGGLSQAWDKEPAADAPMFEQARDGYANLSDKGEGMHKLFVRAWTRDGRQVLASFGPVGYDATPPPAPPSFGSALAIAGTPLRLAWEPAKDSGSGVAGYRIYIGDDPDGRSEWFSEKNEVEAPALAPGTYLVRAQALDVAGNVGPWALIGTLEVK